MMEIESIHSVVSEVKRPEKDYMERIQTALDSVPKHDVYNYTMCVGCVVNPFCEIIMKRSVFRFKHNLCDTCSTYDETFKTSNCIRMPIDVFKQVATIVSQLPQGRKTAFGIPIIIQFKHRIYSSTVNGSRQINKIIKQSRSHRCIIFDNVDYIDIVFYDDTICEYIQKCNPDVYKQIETEIEYCIKCHVLKQSDKECVSCNYFIY